MMFVALAIVLRIGWQTPGAAVETARPEPQEFMNIDKYEIYIHPHFDTETVDLKVHAAAHLLKKSNEFAIHYTGSNPLTLTIDGKAAATTRDGDVLRARLPAAIDAGAAFVYDAEYSGKPGRGLSFRNAGGPPDGKAHKVLFTDGWPDWARSWLPGVDHPLRRAAVALVVDGSVTKAGMRVVTNGKFKETRADGSLVFEEPVEIPTYLIALAIGEYACIDRAAASPNAPEGDLNYFVYPWNYEKAKREFAEIDSILHFYEKTLAPFPYPKLSYVQVPTRFGGMENAACIFIDEKIDLGVPNAGIHAHELAHQWFGDSIGIADWSDVWLSEGFASYFEAVYNNKTETELARRMGEMQDTLLALPMTKEKPIVGPIPEKLDELLNAMSYQKGACVLHALRKFAGEEAFWKGIHRHIQTNGGRAIRTADFARAFGEGAGKDIGKFIEIWTRTKGFPVFSEPISKSNAAGKLTITIEQRQTTAVFPCAFELEIRTAGVARTKEIRFDENRAASVEFDVDHYDSIALDPRRWVLHR